MKNPITTSEKSLLVNVRDVKRFVRRIKDPNGPDPVFGNFIFSLDITATVEDVYIPISISSSKKPTGFVYQIEGTADASIQTADVSSKGDGITQVILGTITYCKIPAGLTASLRINVEMRGKIGASYGIILYLIHWKRNPTDTRYQKLQQDIRTKELKLV